MAYLDFWLLSLKPRVAIIGAGWAGLAAAVELTGQAQLTLFEAGRAPGGRARQVQANGQALDNGQHILLGAYHTCLRLMREVGLDPDQLLLRQPLSWVRRGGLELRCPALPAPWHLLLGLLMARGLSLNDKFKLMRLLTHLSRSGWQISGDPVAQDWLQAQGQSPYLLQEFWRPLVASALNTPLQQASMRTLAVVLRDSLGASRAASDLLLPRVDLSSLFPAPALSWLQQNGVRCCLGQRVRAVVEQGSKLRVEDQLFDAVIVATQPEHAAMLLADSALQQLVKKLEFRSIYTVNLKFAQAPCLSHVMLGVQHDYVDWLFDRHALCGESGRLAAVLSAVDAQQGLSHARLLDEVSGLVRQLLPHLDAPLEHHVLGVRRASFAARPGLQRPEVRLARRGCYLAGDWVQGEYPATLEGAALSGVHAAQALLQDWAAGIVRGEAGERL